VELSRLARTRQLTGLRSAKREFLEMWAQCHSAMSPNGLPESQTSQNDVCATREILRLGSSHVEGL
jgi:hypothetical protein